MHIHYETFHEKLARIVASARPSKEAASAAIDELLTFHCISSAQWHRDEIKAAIRDVAIDAFIRFGGKP